MREKGSGTSSGGGNAQQREAMRALITQEAQSAGVPVAVALAIASLESSFNPNAKGDIGWATKKPEQYRKLVLDKPYFAQNPVRTDPAQWYSRGLFQLLAPYHTRSLEHPDVLFDPQVNAKRGVQLIKELLAKTDNDPLKARLYYTGAIGGSTALQQDTKAKMAGALASFGWKADP